MRIRAIIPVVLCVALPAAWGQEGTPRPATRPSLEYLDAVVAKVNRNVITKSQVDRDLGNAIHRMTPTEYEHESKRRLLQLVFAAIESDAVERVGLVVPKRFVLEQIEQQKERKGAAEVLQGIKEQGYKSEEEYEEALGKDISRQTYLAAQSGQYTKAAQFRPDFWTEPTATEIRQYYRQHTSDEFFQRNQAKTHAIFLPYAAFAAPGQPVDERVHERVREIAALIRADLANGVDFAALARRYGRQIPGADEGGDLGWIAKDSSYPKDLVNFALTGPVKQLSDPILYPTKEAARGIVVVWVSERVEERVMPFAEAQSKIRDTLRQQRVDAARKKIVQKLLEDAYVSPAELKRELLRLYQQ